MKYLTPSSPFNQEKQNQLLTELKRTQIVRGGKDILVTQTSSGLTIARYSLPLLIDDKYQLDMLFNSSTRVQRLCDRKEGELDDIWRVRAMHVQLGDKIDPFHKIMQALNIRGEFYVGWLTDAGVPGAGLRAHDGTPIVAPRIARVGQWGDVLLLDPGDEIASTEDTDKVCLLNIWHDAHFYMGRNQQGEGGVFLDGRLFFVDLPCPPDHQITEPTAITYGYQNACLLIPGDLRGDPTKANTDTAIYHEEVNWRPVIPVPMLILYGPITERPDADDVITYTTWIDTDTGNAAYSDGVDWIDLLWGTFIIHALGNHTDVIISSPADTEVLTYETSSGRWKNKPATGGGVLPSGMDIITQSPTPPEGYQLKCNSAWWQYRQLPTPHYVGMEIIEEILDECDATTYWHPSGGALAIDTVDYVEPTGSVKFTVSVLGNAAIGWQPPIPVDLSQAWSHVRFWLKCSINSVDLGKPLMRVITPDGFYDYELVFSAGVWTPFDIDLHAPSYTYGNPDLSLVIGIDFEGNYSYVPTVLHIDILTHATQELSGSDATMCPRKGAIAMQVSNTSFLYGTGRTGKDMDYDNTDNCGEYDVVTKEWVWAPIYPTTVAEAVAASFYSAYYWYCYAGTGYSESAYQGSWYRYTDSSWAMRADCPMAIASAVAGRVSAADAPTPRDYIAVIAGQSSVGACYGYWIGDNSWTPALPDAEAIPDHPLGALFGAVAWSEYNAVTTAWELFVYGGFLDLGGGVFEAQNALYKLSCAYKTGQYVWSWAQLSSAPLCNSRGDAVVLEQPEHVHTVLTGTNYDAAFAMSSAISYDSEADTWLSEMPFALGCESATGVTVDDGKIWHRFVLGGTVREITEIAIPPHDTVGILGRLLDTFYKNEPLYVHEKIPE